MTTTQTCWKCNGTGRGGYDPTLADKIGLIAKHNECGICAGSGVSGPKPVRSIKIIDQPYEPVPDSFWDSWGV